MCLFSLAYKIETKTCELIPIVEFIYVSCTLMKIVYLAYA